MRKSVSRRLPLPGGWAIGLAIAAAALAGCDERHAATAVAAPRVAEAVAPPAPRAGATGEPASRPAAATGASAAAAWARPRGEGADGPLVDAFAARKWQGRAMAAAAPASAASAPPAPPPPPASAAAPRPPFTFVGKLTEHGDAPMYIFERGARVFSARPGQWLDSQTRFESASASELVLVQVPGDVRHTLRIGRDP